METLVVKAYIKKHLSEKEENKMKQTMVSFVNGLTGIPENEFKIAIKKGSWEIIICLVVPASLWTLDKIASYYFDKGMNYMHLNDKSNNPPFNQMEKLKNNEIYSYKIFKEFMDNFFANKHINNFTVARLYGDDKGHILRLYEDLDTHKYNVDLIETSTLEQFDKTIGFNHRVEFTL